MILEKLFCNQQKMRNINRRTNLHDEKDHIISRENYNLSDENDTGRVLNYNKRHYRQL